MEQDLVVDNEIIIKGHELIMTATRSSGPGGQHVNKTSSKISLRWSIRASESLNDDQKFRLLNRLSSRLVGESEILIHVESERSQYRNRAIAREKLRELIENALKPVKKRTKTKPTMGSKIRRVENKKKRGDLKKMRRQIEE